MNSIIPLWPLPAVPVAGSEAQSKCKVNSQSRQHGDLSDMIRPVADIIANLSGYVTLQPGDPIFTGTPAGVGKAERGDRLEGAVEGVGTLSVTIV